MRDTSKALLQKIVQSMIKRERDGWPPDSLGAYYQPMRPERHEKNKGDDIDESQPNT